MTYPSYAQQEIQNQLDLQENFQKSYRRKPKLIEMPAIIWQNSYGTDQGKGKLLRIIQQLSDYMLLNRSNMFSGNNPNQAYLIDAVRGKLNPNDYFAAEYAYGDKTNIPIRDNHFYQSSKSNLSSQISSQPLEFNTKNVSSEFAEQAVKRAAKEAARMQTNLFAEYAAAAGVDLGFIEQQGVDMSGTVDEILSRLKHKEKMEYIVYRLINHVNYQNDIRRIEKKCFSTKFDVNAEFAFVDVVHGEIIPKYLRPEQVTWVAGKDDIEDLEDSSVVAAAVNDYLTMTEIIQKYAFKLTNGTGALGLYDALRKMKDGKLENYNPNRNYFSEYYHASGLTSDYNDDVPPNLPNWNEVQYNDYFYPKTRSASGLKYTVLEQKMYFKMIVPRRYAVEIHGKAPSDALFKQWQKDNTDNKLQATFKELDPEEKAPKGAKIKEFGKVELWQATRLGHAGIINVGQYEYSTTKKGRPQYLGIPIVMQISYEKSFALLGHHFMMLSNILYNRIEELIISAGLSSAIVFDESVGGDAGSFLYHARKTGVAYFNSTKMRGGNPSKYQHLDVIQMPSHTKDIQEMLAMIGVFKMMYENMIGASQQAQGVAQPYSGLRETQLNIANQNTLSHDKFYEHQLFMNQLLQRIGDIAKKEYAKEEWINVRVSDEEYELLKLTKELDSADIDVLVRSGPDLKSKKELINNAVNQLMASGGIEMLEPLIEIYLTDNPHEAQSILRKNYARLQEAQALRDKQMAETARINAQTETEKAQIPLAQEKIKQETVLTKTEMELAQRRESDDIRGHLSDIKHNQNKESKVLDSELRRGDKVVENQAGLDRDMAFAQADAMLNTPEPQTQQ